MAKATLPPMPGGGRPRDLNLERLNRLSQAVADLMESQAAQNRITARLLDHITQQLDRIEASQLAAAPKREAQRNAEHLRDAAVNHLQQQIDGLADVVMALGAALRMTEPNGQKLVDDALAIVQSFDHRDYPGRPNRAARKAIVDKLADYIPEHEEHMRGVAAILEYERAQAAAQSSG